MLRLRSTVRWLCLALVLSLTGLLAVAAQATADEPPLPTGTAAPVAAWPADGGDAAADTLVDALSDDLGESLLPVIATAADRLPAPLPPALVLREPPFPWTFGLLRPPTVLA